MRIRYTFENLLAVLTIKSSRHLPLNYSKLWTRKSPCESKIGDMTNDQLQQSLESSLPKAVGL